MPTMKFFLCLLLFVSGTTSLVASEQRPPRLLIDGAGLAAKRVLWQSPAFSQMKELILAEAAQDDGAALDDLYDLRIRWHMLAWLMTSDETHLKRIQALVAEMLAFAPWSRP